MALGRAQLESIDFQVWNLLQSLFCIVLRQEGDPREPFEVVVSHGFTHRKVQEASELGREHFEQILARDVHWNVLEIEGVGVGIERAQRRLADIDVGPVLVGKLVIVETRVLLQQQLLVTCR